jgi:hypothetical protein
MGLFNKKPKVSYTCSTCGQIIKRRGLYHVSEMNRKRDAFYNRRHSANTPQKFKDAFDFRDAQYHCYDCLHMRKNWPEENKKCITCDAFVINLTRMPDVADFYCRFNHDAPITNPYDDSCPKWRLAKMYIPFNLD